jgi:glutamate racemase
VSATAVDIVREAYPHIPVYEVITPAVKDAVSVTCGYVGVIGTRATIGSGAYQSQLAQQKGLSVLVQSCPLFVPLVEEGWLETDATESIIATYLEPLRTGGVDTLILGCTHYPLLKKHIQKFMGDDVQLIDSAESVVTQILQGGVIPVGAQTYFFTDVGQHTQQIVERWLEQKLVINKAVL